MDDSNDNYSNILDMVTSRIEDFLYLAGRTQLGEFAPKFAHLAFEVPGENSSNEWLEPVIDEEYYKLK